MRDLEADLKLTVLPSCLKVTVLGWPPFLKEAPGVIAGSRLSIGGLAGPRRRRRRKLVVQDKPVDMSKGDLLTRAGVIWSYLMQRSRWLTGISSSGRSSAARLPRLSSLAMGAGLDLEGRRRGNCYRVCEDGRMQENENSCKCRCV